MANVNLGGFRPWGTLSGGQGVFPNMMIGELANNYGTAIGRYDVLIGVSDGTLARAAAANNGLLIGIANAFSYVINGKREYRPFIPASTTFSPTTVGSKNASLVQYFPLTPDLVLEVDGDDGTTYTTIAGQIGAVGENADMATGDCNSVTGVSTYALDISTHATTAANFRIIGFKGGYTLGNGITLQDNDPASSRFKFLVTCNEGLLPPYTTTGV
jgi:hypothetical protein